MKCAGSIRLHHAAGKLLQPAFPELDDDEILRADMLEAETDLAFLRMIEQKREDALALAEAVNRRLKT